MRSKITLLSMLLLFAISSVQGQVQDTIAMLHSSKTSIRLFVEWSPSTVVPVTMKANGVNLIKGDTATITVINNKVVLTAPKDETPQIRITKMVCNNSGLTDIDFRMKDCFSLLNLMELAGNQLNTLDLTGLTNLEELNCSANQLYTLNLKDVTKLKSLHCEDNHLTILNLSGLTNLGYLNCENNKLTTLHLTGLTELWGLSCSNNQLTSLNLTGLTKLWNMFCRKNQLTSLNLTGCVSLKYMYAEDQAVSVPLSGSNYKNPLNFINPDGQSMSATINGAFYTQNDNLPTNLDIDLPFSFALPTGFDTDSKPFSGAITLGGIDVTGVTVHPTTLLLTVGGMGTVTASVLPFNATNKAVIWSISDVSVATVSSTGDVTPLSVGNAIITATTVDGNKTATCAVTVAPPVGNESLGSTSFSAYPNPTSGAITVTGLTPGKAISIYSVTGILVGAYTAQEEVMTINLDNLNSGMYFMNYEGKTTKIIKN